jgi:hypothetical protein
MFVMLGVLGFNEFVWIITNPILLLLLIILGVGGYILAQTNMWGPAQKAAMLFMRTSMASLNEFVVHAMQQAHGAPASGVEKPKTE